MLALTTSRQRLARWFPLGSYSDPIKRYRAFSTYVIAMLFLVFAPLLHIVVALAVLSSAPLNVPGLFGVGINIAVIYVLALSAILFTRIKRQTLGGVLILILLTVSIGIGVVLNGPKADGLTIFLVLAMWMTLSTATLLTGIRSIWPMAVLILLAVVLLAVDTENTIGL